jgi:hypothetical protein
VWDILEFIGELGVLFSSWRFYLCLALSLAAVGLIYWLIPSQALCLSLSIPVAVIGIGTGIVWQLRKD